MKIKQLCFVSGVALATLGTSAAQAALVVVPTGLAVGDQYRLVFVTAGTRNATSTNINDYNTFVTNQATGGTPGIDTALDTALNGAGFDLSTITWKAIGSTSAVDARDNTGTHPSSTGVPIYLIDGNRVANNNADLWDGSLQHPINRNNLDLVDANGVAWTGSDFPGTGYGSLQLGSTEVVAGSALASNFSWILVNFFGASNLARMYAMSSVLTVPGNQPAPVPVPEPASLLGFITLGSLMLGSAVRKARK
ncbi:PEP-CTERM sorting domain-containing protein [Microcystis sp. T1-4]|uniref:PEP-CTERM sorting domain-containing protein n=1 Tax=Microcystis sp. T1-4 TaxID=1160279 RepID=UPI000262055F|nr:PEP-CTERM sorting domain-containing protein [Microcystis sp. T1-4]CCI32890.1 Similarity [Microcystis sp. T1-4]